MAEHPPRPAQHHPPPPTVVEANHRGLILSPDPTALTSSLVDAAKDELRREMDFIREVLQARLDGSDKAIILLQTSQDRIPQQVEDRVVGMQTLMEQRFATVAVRFEGVQVQFSERDVRTDQTNTTTKIAIDAALQAQKEMVAAQNTNIAQALARIEATANKQIDGLVTLLQTTASASDSKISDLKDRLTLIEGRTAGITSATGTQQVQQTQAQESSKFILAIILAIGSFLGLLVAVGIAILKP